MDHNLFTVHDTGQGLLKVVNATKGIQVGVISPRGKLETPPIVSGNVVSFVVSQPDGTRIGQVHKLPSGSLINQFRA
jgi:hypothetical protein|tara:strand:- start:216 stop:446 length:231 start_codon:yes stop_codon:yes gene_type:complete